MKKLLLRNSAFRFLEILVSILLSILLTPFLIKNLGDGNYGLWILILSTLGWFSFLDMGFSSAIQRNIGLAIEKGDDYKVNVTFSVSIVLCGFLGTIASTSLLILAFFPALLGVNDYNQDVTTIALSVLAIKLLIDFLMNSFHGFYSAYLRMDIDANLSLLNSICKAIAIFYLVIDMNIYGAVAATMLADLISNSLKMYYVKKLHPKLRFDFRYVKWKEVKELFAFSKHVIAMSIAKSINGRVDPLIVSHLLGLKFVALYSVISRLVVMVEGLVKAVVGVFYPILIKLVARKVDLDSTFQKIISINLIIGVLFYSPLAIFSESFIRLWIGEDYTQAADLSFILGFAYICRAISRPVSGVLLAQANHKLLSIVSLFGAITNISLSIFLGSLWGLFGIALATAIGFFISDVILHLILYRYYSKKSVVALVLKFLLTFTLYVSLVLIGKYLVGQFLPLSWWELAVALILAESLVFIIVCPLLLHKSLRLKALEYLFKKAS